MSERTSLCELVHAALEHVSEPWSRQDRSWPLPTGDEVETLLYLDHSEYGTRVYVYQGNPPHLPKISRTPLPT